MRISHKRNIQRKLHKQKPLFSHPVFAVKKMPEVELVIDTPVIADTAIFSNKLLRLRSKATTSI